MSEADESLVVKFRTKPIELDASHEDALLRIAFDGDDREIGRKVAPFLLLRANEKLSAELAAEREAHAVATKERDNAIWERDDLREQVAGLTKQLSAAYVANIGEHGVECSEQATLTRMALAKSETELAACKWCHAKVVQTSRRLESELAAAVSALEAAQEAHAETQSLLGASASRSAIFEGERDAALARVSVLEAELAAIKAPGPDAAAPSCSLCEGRGKLRGRGTERDCPLCVSRLRADNQVMRERLARIGYHAAMPIPEAFGKGPALPAAPSAVRGMTVQATCEHGTPLGDRCVYCVAESSNDAVGSPVWPPPSAQPTPSPSDDKRAEALAALDAASAQLEARESCYLAFSKLKKVRAFIEGLPAATPGASEPEREPLREKWCGQCKNTLLVYELGESCPVHGPAYFKACPSHEPSTTPTDEPEPPTTIALKAKIASLPSDKVAALWDKLQRLADEPPPDESLIAYVRHEDGTKTPITPKQWAQAVLAHPKATDEPAPGSGEAETCSCARCEDERRAPLLRQMMILCPVCGNKRCPKAAFHGYRCGNSNEPGQIGIPEQVEPASEPEAPRAVLVGQVWRSKLYGFKRTVIRLSGEHVHVEDVADGCTDVWPASNFVERHEWVSNPPSETTREP